MNEENMSRELPHMGAAAVRGEAVAEMAATSAFREAMPKRAAFIEWAVKRGLDVSVKKDAWGAQIFAHDHIQCMWTGWFSAPSVSARAADAPSEPSQSVMRAALERIARWHGEFPDTGKTWPTGGAVSYAAEYGSNGERDYMRQIAVDALKSRAADALDSQPTEWLPTPEAINALPPGVRKYVHDLVANSDPAGTVANNTLLVDNCENLQAIYRKHADVLEEVRGCFSAAEAEGLSEALAETTDERLKDLVERRLMYALHAVLARSQPTDGGVRNG